MARTLTRPTPTPTPPPPPAEWQRNREVQRLTKEILALQRDAGAQVVAAMVEMGDRMRKVRAALEHGQWLAWVETAVPFSARTITSAMRLSEWAQEQPRELTRLEHLGPTKLYLLAALPADHRKQLTGRVPLVIPGHPVPKTIEVMTIAELAKVIGNLTTRPSPRKPIGKVMQGLRYRIAGLDTVADELVQRRDEVDADQARTVLDALRTVLDELERAFEG